MKHVTLIVPILLSIIGCTAVNKSLSNLNTSSSGLSAYPTGENEFHPSFNYKSYSFLKSDILKDTSVIHSWLTQGPLYSRKEADSLVSLLPPGGFIELSTVENKYNAIASDAFILDSLKVFSLPDSIPMKITVQEKMEFRSSGSYGQTYYRNNFIRIEEVFKDSALIMIHRTISTGNVRSHKTTNSWIIAPKSNSK